MFNKKWYWYVARDNELFIDLDRYKESINHIRRRLQGAIEYGALNVENVHLFLSLRHNHRHLVVILKKPLQNRYEAFAWEMLLHSDIYRTAANIMRYSRNVPSSDILISRKLLHRQSDDTCKCEAKHNRAAMETCAAAIALRGEKRNLTFFGKPSDTIYDVLHPLYP